MSDNGFLDRAQLLDKRSRRYKVVDLPGGGKVRVQSMTAAERGLYEASFLDKKTGQTRPDRMAKARELLLIATVVDNEGKRIFGPNDAVDISAMDIGVVEAIYEAAIELNKISDADINELVGNSNATQS